MDRDMGDHHPQQDAQPTDLLRCLLGHTHVSHPPRAWHRAQEWHPQKHRRLRHELRLFHCRSHQRTLPWFQQRTRMEHPQPRFGEYPPRGVRIGGYLARPLGRAEGEERRLRPTLRHVQRERRRPGLLPHRGTTRALRPPTQRDRRPRKTQSMPHRLAHQRDPLPQRESLRQVHPRQWHLLSGRRRGT